MIEVWDNLEGKTIEKFVTDNKENLVTIHFTDNTYIKIIPMCFADDNHKAIFTFEWNWR